MVQSTPSSSNITQNSSYTTWSIELKLAILLTIPYPILLNDIFRKIYVLIWNVMIHLKKPEPCFGLLFLCIIKIKAMSCPLYMSYLFSGVESSDKLIYNITIIFITNYSYVAKTISRKEKCIWAFSTNTWYAWRRIPAGCSSKPKWSPLRLGMILGWLRSRGGRGWGKSRSRGSVQERRRSSWRWAGGGPTVVAVEADIPPAAVRGDACVVRYMIVARRDVSHPI